MWATFKGWHGTESLWREIYARTVSALVALFAAFLVAAAANAGATREALPDVLFVLFAAVLWPGFVLWVVMQIAYVLNQHYDGKMTLGRSAVSLLLTALTLAMLYLPLAVLQLIL